jgi:uncharacterized protein YyaL (SSP411 family)
MTLVRTQELFDTAANSRVGVAAFNVITLEHVEAITAGAEAAAAPAILQVSQNAVKFHGRAVRPLAAALQEIAHAASVDLALHLDHVDDITLLHKAADSGFSSVMFDASMLDYAANIAATDEVARGHTGVAYSDRSCRPMEDPGQNSFKRGEVRGATSKLPLTALCEIAGLRPPALLMRNGTIPRRPRCSPP